MGDHLEVLKCHRAEKVVEVRPRLCFCSDSWLWRCLQTGQANKPLYSSDDLSSCIEN